VRAAFAFDADAYIPKITWNFKIENHCELSPNRQSVINFAEKCRQCRKYDRQTKESLSPTTQQINECKYSRLRCLKKMVLIFATILWP